MTSRRTFLLSFAFAALFAMLAASDASAQEPWWRGGNNRDDNYRRSGYLNDRERRALRDAARRIDDRGRSFQRNIDRALDQSRIDDTQREDRINADVRDFRNAAERFRDRAGDERDLYRSEGEARALLNSASRIDRYVSRVRLDARTRSDWQQIRSDLRAVANIYNLRFDSYGNDGRYENWPERDRGRDRQRRNNGTWRWPF